MNQLPSHQECPVNLGYAEPAPPHLDVSKIVRRGRGIRRRRRIRAAAVAAAACAALASVITAVQAGTFRWSPAPAARPAAGPGAPPAGALIATYPPASGRLTLLSNWPRHWTTVAWATRQGVVCWAAYRRPAQGTTGGYGCPGWYRGDIPGPGSHRLSGLLPGVSPVSTGDTTLVPELGLAPPDATRVTVTFFGRDFTAGVVRLPVGGGRATGIYLVWLRLPGNVVAYGSNDVSGAIAYDAAGHVVARHGPGM